MPAEQSSGDSDTAPVGNVSATPAGNSASAAQTAPNFAFRAHVMEKDTAQFASQDSFVRGASTKPAGVTQTHPTVAEVAPVSGNHAGQSGSDSKSNADGQGKEPSRPEKTSTTEEASQPRQVEQTVAKPAEPANSIYRPATATSSNPDAGISSAARTPSDAPVAQAHVSQPVVSASETRPAPPIRDVSVRLDSDSQRVDVKLSERNGELHVEVKSVDPALTTDLRAGLHELIGGLDKSGFRAEAWHPGETQRHNADATAGVSRSSGDQPQSQSGEDPRRQGRNAHDPEYAQPRRNRGSNTEWMNQINALSGAEKEN